MKKHNQSSHLPYGAYELKASYQRNMLMGMLLTMLLVVAGVVTLAVVSKTAQADERLPGDEPDTIYIDIDWIQPPPIDKGDPFEGKGGPKPDPPEIPAALNPVADSLLDDDVQILSRAELAEYISSRGPDIEGEEYGNGFAIEVPAEVNFFPEPDSFIIVDEQPQMVFASEPDYPSLPKKAGLEGVVWVKALVDTDGQVRKAIIGRGSGVVALDEAALESARKCRYRPAIRAGKAVAVWVTYKVEFTLDR